MKIQLHNRVKELEIDSIKARVLLKELGISPGAALVIKNDVLVCEDEILTAEDSIRIIKTISGG
ncbi:MAG: hypothetical protein JW844_05110 [Candidatus Omnitrophica bacterium]|nr:hypothetical protein [Candidatus Omnitrophota bacterium]